MRTLMGALEVLSDARDAVKKVATFVQEMKEPFPISDKSRAACANAVIAMDEAVRALAQEWRDSLGI